MDVSRHWRLRQQRYSLVGESCPHCEFKIFPPRDLCPDCGENAKTIYQFSGRGQVYSHSTVQEAPQGFKEQAPYTVALVQLEEGPLVSAQLTDLGELSPKVGMPVEMVTRKLRAEGDRGMLVYGYKFRPAMQGSPQ